MEKNKKQLAVIITLICCTVAMLACGVFVACKGIGDDKNAPTYSTEDDSHYTSNY